MVRGVPGPGGCAWSRGRAGAWSRRGCMVQGCAWSGGCAWSRGVPGLGGCLVPGWGGVGIPACTEADPPPGQTATAADGTHPTGMHSC